jgi:hypothetical protein
MPITWSYDAPRNVVILRLESSYTFDEWRAKMNAILAAVPPDYLPIRFLVDQRLAATPSVGVATSMVDYFTEQAARWHGSRAAIIVSDDSGYGMARLVAIRTELADIRFYLEVFRELEDALRWLGIGEG